MKKKLLELLKNSYSPYSNFPVASIVVMKDGKTFSGVNVENASYGATICAERSAITSAITNGYKVHDFKEIYVMTKNEDFSPCCFICRQLLVEFFDKSSPVILMNPSGEFIVKTVEELCPYPFSKDDL